MKAAVYDDKNKECHDNEEEELRRGPWTLEEDTLLIHYVACHGEGRWNLLAKSSGLKRTGKSCRLRWLNYLKPDIKRGNLTPQEQLLILELHSKWGNRWSKIAQHLPGRTDNEIKNYWRTRVQKQAKQLNMESNSQRFIDAIRCFYMPRLVQKIEQSSSASTPSLDHEDSTSPPFKFGENSSIYQINNHNSLILNSPTTDQHPTETSANICKGTYPEVCYNVGNSSYDVDLDSSMSALGEPDVMPHDCHMEGNNWMEDDTAYDPWSCLDELWQFRK